MGGESRHPAGDSEVMFVYCQIMMCLANGGHPGDFGNCAATASWQELARVTISSGNLGLAGIHRVLDY